MRELRKWVWTAVITVAAVVPASAQQGTITSAGGRSTGSLSGTGGLTGGGAGQLGGGGLGGGAGGGGLGGGAGGGGGLGGTQLQGTALQTMTAPPKLTAPTGQNSSTLASSNRLAGYYANPYFQGISLQTNAVPGGFGSALYGNATSGAGGRGAIGGTTGGLGGGIGGGRGQSSTQSGILIPIPVQINYTAQMRFPTPPIAPSKMQADIRAIIDNTNQIANPQAVQIILDANNNVTLRGTVADDDEARLIEGLVRLTPGVRRITNELTATASSAPGK